MDKLGDSRPHSAPPAVTPNFAAFGFASFEEPDNNESGQFRPSDSTPHRPQSKAFSRMLFRSTARPHSPKIARAHSATQYTEQHAAGWMSQPGRRALPAATSGAPAPPCLASRPIRHGKPIRPRSASSALRTLSTIRLPEIVGYFAFDSSIIIG